MSRSVHVRLSDEDYTRLASYAASDRRPIAEWVRLCALREVEALDELYAVQAPEPTERPSDGRSRSRRAK